MDECVCQESVCDDCIEERYRFVALQAAVIELREHEMLLDTFDKGELVAYTRWDDTHKRLRAEVDRLAAVGGGSGGEGIRTPTPREDT